MPNSPITTVDRDYRDDTLVAYQRGVERAIQLMHERLGESLNVDDLAAAAFMSRFHFTRVFSKITAVSPGRFLAAIRMQEAKRLLLMTDLSVTDISLHVGYNSLGTFTRIFADFVGYPPVRFRLLSRLILNNRIKELIQLIPQSYEPCKTNIGIFGEVGCDVPLSLISVAIFPTRLPRSRPIECICLTTSRSFSFRNWARRESNLFAVGLTIDASMEDAVLLNQSCIRVGVAEVQNRTTDSLSIILRMRELLDPPVVFAFPLIIAQSLLSRT